MSTSIAEEEELALRSWLVEASDDEEDDEEFEDAVEMSF